MSVLQIDYLLLELLIMVRVKVPILQYMAEEHVLVWAHLILGYISPASEAAVGSQTHRVYVHVLVIATVPTLWYG